MTQADTIAAPKATDDELQTDEQLISLLDARTRTYGMFARLYREEVDEEEIKQLQAMRFPVATGNINVDAGYRMLFDYLKTAWADSVTELAVDYVRTFIGHGVNGYSAAYPFESVYTSERRLLMQEARAEVLATLRENGLKSGRWNEGEDHIGLEMEFMQRLGIRAKEALEAGDEDACIKQLRRSREFMEEHLLNWMPMLTADMRKFSRTNFYKGLATLSLAYVQEDATLLDELLESAEE